MLFPATDGKSCVERLKFTYTQQNLRDSRPSFPLCAGAATRGRLDVQLWNKRRRRESDPAPVVMGNVRVPANKSDELSALTRSDAECERCSILCIIETWPKADNPDSAVALDGFHDVQEDGSVSESNKEKGFSDTP